MTSATSTRRLFAVNLKAYFGRAETVAWLLDLARRLHAKPLPSEVELAVLPSFPLLEQAVRRLGPVGVSVGAQDVSEVEGGPFTGEVPAAMLAEIGCRYAEVGHAERRIRFGETDALVAAKAAAAVRHGLVPLICVGETEHLSSRLAAEEVVRQVGAALAELPDGEVAIAYEPLWAIGAEEPASAGHVRTVGRALREELTSLGQAARIIYGGSAGPGTLRPLEEEFDGLFLGRRAHRIDGLLLALNDACSSARGWEVRR